MRCLGEPERGGGEKLSWELRCWSYVEFLLPSVAYVKIAMGSCRLILVEANALAVHLKCLFMIVCINRVQTSEMQF